MKNSRIKLFATIALALLAGCNKVGNEDGNEPKDGEYFVLNRPMESILETWGRTYWWQVMKSIYQYRVPDVFS